jgi:hypothetical protein
MLMIEPSRPMRDLRRVPLGPLIVPWTSRSTSPLPFDEALGALLGTDAESDDPTTDDDGVK